MFGFTRPGTSADDDVFDMDFVRSQFPAFTEPKLSGWAFFENAGGSYPCLHAVDRLTEFYRRLDTKLKSLAQSVQCKSENYSSLLKSQKK